MKLIGILKDNCETLMDQDILVRHVGKVEHEEYANIAIEVEVTNAEQFRIQSMYGAEFYVPELIVDNKVLTWQYPGGKITILSTERGEQ